MSKILNGKVYFNDGAIADKVQGITHSLDVMIDISTLFVKTVDPWVPYDTGYLSKEVYFEQDIANNQCLIRYEAPYAAKQYYGTHFNHNTEHHPLATAYWDKVAMQTEHDAFVKKAEEIVKNKAKEVKNGQK